MRQLVEPGSANTSMTCPARGLLTSTPLRLIWWRWRGGPMRGGLTRWAWQLPGGASFTWGCGPVGAACGGPTEPGAWALELVPVAGCWRCWPICRPRVAVWQDLAGSVGLSWQLSRQQAMAKDPKARVTTVSYEGGTVSAALGLLQWLFGAEDPKWGASSIGTTQLGRRRYKYGSRKRDSAAAGKQVFLDLGEDGIYSVRVTGDIVDFIDKMLPKTDNRVKQVWTRRGSKYGPTLPNI
jgi:hypothetical protein